MAPKASATSEDSTHESSTFSASSITSSSHHSGGLELSSSSHSIAKHNLKKKGPIIRVVHVFAPKLIKTDPANFRALVQKLTGNHSSNEEEQEAAQVKSSHNHSLACNQAIDHVKQQELRYQKEKEATIPAYSSAISSSSAVLNTQFEEDYEHSFLHYGSVQASYLAGLATRVHESNGYFPELARIEERDEYFPANQGGLARSDEGINYFPLNYYDNDDVYNQSSPSSLDTSSSTRGGSFQYERDNPSGFSEELDIMGPSYPFINLDDQHLPQLCMSPLDTKLDFSLLNPTW